MMGQAFDRDGNVLGGAVGESMRDVLEQLERRHPDAARIELGHYGAEAELPRYKCHKEVHAIRIAAVQKAEDGAALLLVESPFAPIKVDNDWISKHSPEVGGFYVVYEDGYTSFSPAKAFLAGYTRIAR